MKQIIKQLDFLNKKRTFLIFSLLQGKPMINGTPLVVYRRCGKQNCRCYKGDRHGPYIALSINENGIQRFVMVKKQDIPHVLKKAKRYKYFQKTLSEIRKINKEIDKLLVSLRSYYTDSYR